MLKELKKAASGGGGGAKIKELTAAAAHVLEGKRFLGTGTKNVQVGTCRDRSQRGTSPGYSESSPNTPAHISESVNWTTDTDGNNVAALAPPAGQYPGNGGAFVTCQPDELGITPEKVAVGESIGPVNGTYGADANAAAKDIREGRSAYGSNGRIEGNAVDHGAVNSTLNAGEEYAIREGFYREGKVKAKDLKSQTSATAAAGDIRSGKTAYVNGVKVTGNLKDETPSDKELSAGGSVSYSAGIKNAAWKVTAKTLAAQTEATAAAAQILKGFTAWVNGLKVTGTMKKASDSKKTTLTATDTRPVIQQTRASSGDARVWDIKNADGSERLCIQNPVEGFWAGTDVLGVPIGNIATAIGAAAAKIVSGNTIAGVAGTARRHGHAHGTVTSSTSYQDAEGYAYSVTIELPFIPVTGYVICYTSGQDRDITIIDPNTGGGKSYRMVNFNQNRLHGFNSIGYSEGDNGFTCAGKKVVLPASYRGQSYAYFFSGYYE